MVPIDNTTPDSFTPALGQPWLTPVYDLAIAAVTRERVWRGLLVRQIDATPGDRILDVGCGTGTLAMMIARGAPKAALLGIDPDSVVLQRARKKTAAAGVPIRFVQGFLTEEALAEVAPLTKITSSLVLHQVPREEKRRILSLMHGALGMRGELHIADYGEQRTPLSRFLFQRTVQSLDGFENTQPNADGILPVLMREVGFGRVEEPHRIATPTGSISIYRCTR
ncbi:MAG: class I SAM-dependent methyltransferase [Alphaproteobacteria bacterium]